MGGAGTCLVFGSSSNRDPDRDRQSETLTSPSGGQRAVGCFPGCSRKSGWREAPDAPQSRKGC